MLGQRHLDPGRGRDGVLDTDLPEDARGEDEQDDDPGDERGQHVDVVQALVERPNRDVAESGRVTLYHRNDRS